METLAGKPLSPGRAHRTTNMRAAEAASAYEASLALRAAVQKCTCPCCTSLALQYACQGAV